MRRALLTTVLGVLGACASTVATQDAAALTRQDPVVAAARWYLEHKPKTKRRDCSGLVEAVLKRAGVTVRGNSESFWWDAKREGRLRKKPQPGDLAFFDRTYDRNRNGRVDDSLTHVAVVTKVEPDGTVHMVHRGSGKIRPLVLNLKTPSLRRRDGKVLNDPLKSPRYGDKKSPKLAGQLLRGFARPPR